MNKVFNTLVCAVLLSIPPGSMHAQTRADPAWVREYAKPGAPGETGNENGLNGDPRFQALLQASFHQGQTFWMDHGHFPSVTELVHQFIGVPGDVVLDQDRYVTANGCVPHDCGDSGFVWIDTRGEGKPLVLFVSTGAVSGWMNQTETHMHLRIFASRKLSWQQMPPPFLQSFSHWYTAGQTKYLAYQVDLVTLVEPNGQTLDLAPSFFHFNDLTDKQHE